MAKLTHGGESGVSTPNRQTVFGVVLLAGLELLLATTYVAVRAVRITNPLILVYPFLWVNVSLLAILTADPEPETTRQRLVGVGIAGGYFLVLGYFGGLYGLGNGMIPLHVD